VQQRKRRLSGSRIGPQIAQARREAGLTQTELAERIGRKQPDVSAIELDKVAPTVATLCRIADALDLDWTYDGRAIVLSPRQ